MTRRAGLQEKWQYVADSLDALVPVYARGSSAIALFGDSRMRMQAVTFAASPGDLVLDLGSGPGEMASEVSKRGATPVLVDYSRRMLTAATGDRVQAVFEHLPFRDGAFDSVVAGFSLRDSRDLATAVAEVRRVLAEGGKFSFCDLGKSDRFAEAMALGLYLRVAAPLMGMLTGGRTGLKFGSLYDTYILTLTNGALSRFLGSFFSEVQLTSKNMGGSIVVLCTA